MRSTALTGIASVASLMVIIAAFSLGDANLLAACRTAVTARGLRNAIAFVTTAFTRTAPFFPVLDVYVA